MVGRFDCEGLRQLQNRPVLYVRTYIHNAVLITHNCVLINVIYMEYR